MNTSTWSKKLVFALVVIVCGTALAHNGTIGADKWLDLVQTIGLGYILTQGGIDLVRGKKPNGVNS